MLNHCFSFSFHFFFHGKIIILRQFALHDKVATHVMSSSLFEVLFPISQEKGN